MAASGPWPTRIAWGASPFAQWRAKSDNSAAPSSAVRTSPTSSDSEEGTAVGTVRRGGAQVSGENGLALNDRV